MTPTQIALPCLPVIQAPDACALPMTVDVVPEYRYRLVTTGSSSDVYGKCEVCGKPCGEVFHQVEEQHKSNAWTFGWTQDGCSRLFGHKACLMGRRRRLDPTIWPTPETQRAASATPQEAVQALLEAAREAARLDDLSSPPSFWEYGMRSRTDEAVGQWRRLLYAKSEAEARIGLYFDIVPAEEQLHTIRRAQALYADTPALLSPAQRTALAAIEAQVSDRG